METHLKNNIEEVISEYPASLSNTNIIIMQMQSQARKSSMYLIMPIEHLQFQTLTNKEMNGNGHVFVFNYDHVSL